MAVDAPYSITEQRTRSISAAYKHCIDKKRYSECKKHVKRLQRLLEHEVVANDNWSAEKKHVTPFSTRKTSLAVFGLALYLYLVAFGSVIEICTNLFPQSLRKPIIQMYLPDEIVVAILDDLERSDLKSARLVCKTWCSYASRFLFDRIFVAPNKVDLEVFNAITQHPTLSKCVRHLVYDGCEFMSDLSEMGYVKSLWAQTNIGARFEKIEHSLDSPDLQINDWICDVDRVVGSFADLFNKWKDRSLINDGYKVYQQHSYYQQGILESGEFTESLVQGLARLVCLKSVSLEGEWPPVQRSFDAHHNGTPLARRWNPFHCYPDRWRWEPERDGCEDPPDGMRHYWIITAALVRTQRHIDDFAIGANDTPGVSPEVFRRKDPERPNALGLDIAALSALKRLHLRIASYDDGLVLEYCDSIDGLGKLLGSMHSLQSLDLQLPETFGEEDFVSLLGYDQVFPKIMTWNKLKDLTLFNFASSAPNLLRLLLIQMPNLENVKIGYTQLLDGCWESVVECLKQFNQFRTFVIGCESALYHHGEEMLECDNGDITDYVLRGGRHPCLSDSQPTSASEDFMLKIEASLRDRLQEMKPSRIHAAMQTLHTTSPPLQKAITSSTSSNPALGAIQ